jgi:hypothetical protein
MAYSAMRITLLVSRSEPVREMSEYTKELYYPCMTALTAKHPSSVQVAAAAAVTLMKYEALKSGTANVGVYMGTQSPRRWPSKADIDARLVAGQ